MGEPSFDDLRTLEEMRLRDAQILHDASRHSAAYYLAGYAIECGLKSIIAQTFRAGVIPSKALVNKVYTHSLVDLINLAGMSAALKERELIAPEFKANWGVASGWNENARYEMIDPFRSAAMLSAAAHHEHGILPWLKTHW